MSGAGPARFDVERLRVLRRAARLGHTIHYAECVESTNDVAARVAGEGAAEGTVIIAETQTRGRGRLGRQWMSPAGLNLYMSVVLRPRLFPAQAPGIALTAGLAVAEAAAEWAPGAALKWPNDVLLDGRKLAGLLAEMNADGDQVRYVVLGIGVNLNSGPEDFPLELRDKAVGLRSATPGEVDRVAFADRLLAHLESRYALLEEKGFAALRPLWERRSGLTGRRVRVVEGDLRHEGVVIGIDADGALRLRDAQGVEIRVVAGDVSVENGYAASPPGALAGGA